MFAKTNRCNMQYITVKDAAEKWQVSTRRVQILCSQNRIKGAYRFGKSMRKKREIV